MEIYKTKTDVNGSLSMFYGDRLVKSTLFFTYFQTPQNRSSTPPSCSAAVTLRCCCCCG